jgi:hypothetical protein
MRKRLKKPVKQRTMKNNLNYRFVFLLILAIFLGAANINSVNAQTPKKTKVRLKMNYVKVMHEEIYFDIEASARIDKENIKVSDIEVVIYNEYEGEEIGLGTAYTNRKGKAKFSIPDISALRADSTNTYNVGVSFYGNDKFRKASKSISFKNADIDASIVTIDSLNYFTATIKDATKDSLIEGASLSVQVERMFQPLFIGEEFYITDDNGTIFVPVEHGIPGLDGNLNISVVMDENEDYGTVIDKFVAPIGTPIVQDTTFDERNMWSPRNKTPLFLLFFVNAIILGMWGFIVYLTYNLFRIHKSKNKN